MRIIGFCKTSYSDTFTWNEDNFNAQLNHFARNNKHVVHSVYLDNEISNEPNKCFSNILNKVKAFKSGFLIVIPDSKHVAKELEEAARIAIEVASLQCEIICLDEEYPDFLQNSIAYIPAPGVSLNKSKNIRSAMKELAISGKALGKPPYGYQINNQGNLTPEENESNVVREIFDLYVNSDLGLRKIAQKLNNKEIKTRSGKDWNIVTLRDILKNTTCIGTYSRFGLRLTNNHDSIIDSHLFRLAQDKTRSRRHYKAFIKSEPYLLSGLCKCGYCGNTMVGVSTKQSWHSQSGAKSSNKYRYYKCQSKNNQETCGYHTWPTQKLESKVLQTIIAPPFLDNLKANMTGEAGDSKRMKATESRLRKVAQAEKRFVDFFKKTAIGKSVLQRLALYLDDLDASRAQAFLSVDTKNVDIFLNSWDSQDFQSQQAFLNEYLEEIRVKDRSIKIII